MASIGRSWSLRASKTFRAAMKGGGGRLLPKTKEQKLSAYRRMRKVTKYGEWK